MDNSLRISTPDAPAAKLLSGRNRIPRVAAYLGVNARTVHRMIAEGQIGYVRVGDRNYCTRNQVLQYLEANTHEAAGRGGEP